MRLAIGSLVVHAVLLLFATSAIAEETQIFDKDGNRIGRAWLNPYGTYELFDAKSRRIGEGRPSPFDGSIRFYGTDGQPMFELRDNKGKERRR